MKIRRFGWRNFRNLTEGEIYPSDNVNVICGKNAQGKTNLLEGMWLFTGERSFRGAKDAALVRSGCTSAEICLDFYGADRDQTAKIAVADGRRSAELNGVKKRSCTALFGEFRAAVFSPEHLTLLQGGPAGRRNFIDAAMCQIKPAYAAIFAEYSRSLAQRNALLKDIPRCADLLDTLAVWDDRLVQFGTKMMRGRASYLQKLAPRAARFYAGMCAGREELALSYEPSAPNLAEALKKSRQDDIRTGHTGAGPHRDDIAVSISGMDARLYGSQGQKRSAVIALKLAEAEMLQQATGETPVIFLDDVLSELDTERQNYLLNRLEGFQVFLTCCGPDAARAPKCGAVFRVADGVPQKLMPEWQPDESGG